MKEKLKNLCKEMLDWKKLDGLLIAIVLIAVDLVSKYFVDQHPLGTPIATVIPGIFYITPSHNKGMAFSMLAGKPWAMTFFIVLTSVCMVIFTLWYLLTPRSKKIMRYSLVLIIAGALANLYDRVKFGYVRDFLDFPWFANCNIADFCIVIGGILMMVYMIFIDDDGLVPIPKLLREKKAKQETENE